MIFLLIFLAFLILPVIYAISLHNSIQRSKIKTDESRSGIGVQLQQRNDIIPNLVETVKGYASHESSTLNDVIKWRNQSANARTFVEQNQAETGLSRAMMNIMAVSENYPNLKADVHFQQLQSQLSILEEKIQLSRDRYNSEARNYNSQLVVFPGNMVANFFNLKPVDFFIEEAESHKVPKVSF
jgi:LemA protein